MADLDFIDQIVDQCLGSGVEVPQQRPLSARSQQQTQSQQAQFSNINNNINNNNYIGANPSASVNVNFQSPPPRQQFAQARQQPQPPSPSSQHQQQIVPAPAKVGPSHSSAMPSTSPVPRDSERSAAPYSYSIPFHPSQHGGEGGGGYPLGSAAGGAGPQEYRGGGAQPYYDVPAIGGGARASSPVGGDAALRRIQMWEEKKKLKQQMARRELEAKGREEYTFKPDIQGARDSVLAGRMKGAAKGTVGFGYGGGNNGLTASARIPVTSPDGGAHNNNNNNTSSLSSHQHLMTPSKLYKDNKAWGFDSFVDRQVYAREMRRQAEEEAAAVFALKNPDGRPQRVTVPEPFEFGNKGRKAVRKTLESPAPILSRLVKKEQSDFYADDSSVYDPHHCSSGAHFNDSDYYTRQYRAQEAITAPTVPAGLFSLQASGMMLEYTDNNNNSMSASPGRR